MILTSKSLWVTGVGFANEHCRSLKETISDSMNNLKKII